MLLGRQLMMVPLYGVDTAKIAHYLGTDVQVFFQRAFVLINFYKNISNGTTQTGLLVLPLQLAPIFTS
jgi:hypothetical protein